MHESSGVGERDDESVTIVCICCGIFILRRCRRPSPSYGHAVCFITGQCETESHYHFPNVVGTPSDVPSFRRKIMRTLVKKFVVSLVSVPLVACALLASAGDWQWDHPAGFKATGPVGGKNRYADASSRSYRSPTPLQPTLVRPSPTLPPHRLPIKLSHTSPRRPRSRPERPSASRDPLR